MDTKAQQTSQLNLNASTSVTDSVKSTYYSLNSLIDEMGNTNGFSILNLNIRSIKKKLGLLTDLLSTLQSKFTLIGVTETWLDSHMATMCNIDGYNHIFDVRKNRIGGGTSLFISKNIKYQLRPELNIFNDDINSVFVELDKSTTSNNKPIIVGLIYRPPNTSTVIFNNSLEVLLNMVTKSSIDIYMMGDFNIDTYQSNSLNSIHFTSIFNSNGYCPVINNPTRIKGECRSLLDNIYSNKNSSCFTSGILLNDMSDHYPVFCLLRNSNLITKDKFIQKRDYSYKNISVFKKKLRQTNWMDIFTEPDGNIAFTSFINIFNKMYNSIFPLQSIRIKYCNRKPWLSKALLKSIQHKNKLYCIAIKQKSELNKHNYRTYKNILTSLLRKAEKAYYDNQFKRSAHNPAKYWKVLKNIMGKDRCNIGNSITLDTTEQLLTDNYDVACEFNKYFVNIGNSLSHNVTSHVDPLNNITPSLNSMFLPQITEGEIINILSAMKNSSAGWDGISGSIVKQCIPEYVKPLAYICNTCFRQGTFPNELKRARVVPLFKKGDAKQTCNYRPISVLSFFSKLFEKIMHTFLLNFISPRLSKHQFGFRPRHSTQHAVSCLIDKLTKNLDDGNIAVGVFLDLQKAFDTVNHNILIKKLGAYGVRGEAQAWLKSYLTNRQQFVSINNVNSSLLNISCGVPQGSILGPLLFIIYINDLPDVSNILWPVIYADDTNVIHFGQDLKSVVDTVNEELDKINIWLKSNKLVLNLKKSHYVVFHRARFKISDDFKVKLQGYNLERKSSSKFLGITIDQKLNWAEHLSILSKQISRNIGILYKCRCFVSKHTLRSLYFSFIESHLAYCIEIWGNVDLKYISSLIKLQKKVVRIITFSPYLAHTASLFKELNILPLKKLYLYRIGIVMYKYNNNLVPSGFRDLFTHNHEVHHYNTRSNNKLHLPRGKHSQIYKNFTFVSTHVWNRIISNIDINVSLMSYKYNLRCYIALNDIKLFYDQ